MHLFKFVVLMLCLYFGGMSVAVFAGYNPWQVESGLLYFIVFTALVLFLMMSRNGNGDRYKF